MSVSLAKKPVPVCVKIEFGNLCYLLNRSDFRVGKIKLYILGLKDRNCFTSSSVKHCCGSKTIFLIRCFVEKKTINSFNKTGE